MPPSTTNDWKPLCVSVCLASPTALMLENVVARKQHEIAEPMKVVLEWLLTRGKQNASVEMSLENQHGCHHGGVGPEIHEISGVGL